MTKISTARATLGTHRVGRSHKNITQYEVDRRRRQAKVALKAGSEDELLELEAIAKSLNLCARSIQDA
jgi:peptidyl-tRNA hydrolase